MGTIEHIKTGGKGAFVYMQSGRQMAEMAYVMAGDHRMIIDHTEVNEALKGQQIGKKLLHELVLYVREHNIKVLPLCPFAKRMLDKMVEWQDVL